ncbi:MAG: hypothetical protein U5M51_16415 [Emticicia sp.]|nr:hypothetical protein [Emticicia sp.]
MNNLQKIIILWLLFVVCMILHFNYHVGELFYGIDIKRPDANGVVPASAAIVRLVFQIAPMMFITFLMFIEKSWLRVFNFSVSILYTLANVAHLIQEIIGEKPDLSQINLLIFTLVASLLLNLASWKWWKENNL